MLNLVWHEIRSRRNAIIGWSIGLAVFALMYTTIYPEMQGQMQDQMAGLADLSVYQAMGIELATFEGYLVSSVIGFIPILLGVYAVMTATTTLAGEEDNGTLELLLTTRMKRWQIVTAKAIALLIVTAIIVGIASLTQLLAFMLIEGQIETIVTRGNVVVVVLSTLPLIWSLLMLALFFGTFFPTRRLAMMGGLLILVFSYFGENLGELVEAMEVIKPYSLFSYFDSSSAVFHDGVAFSDVAVLLTIALISFGLALVSFQRRDVTVGNWPWQRVRLS